MATFRDAERSRDDRELTTLSREVMRTTLGAIEFSRDSSFMESLAHTYDASRTIVCEEEGRIVGMGSCAYLRARILDEEPISIGYLIQLRSLEDARRKTLLARGYRAMRDALKDDGSTMCVSIVLADNEPVRALLEAGGRAGIPPYVPITKLRTYLFRRRRVQKFANDTTGISQRYSLCICGDARTDVRAIRLSQPTLLGRLVGTALMRSPLPLYERSFGIRVASLTDWARTPKEQVLTGDAELYSITLDVRDARSRTAERHSCYRMESILYAVAWQRTPELERVLLSPLPIYFDAGKL